MSVLTPDNPTLKAFIADPQAAPACVDWLQDAGATLADVLLLYAGTEESGWRDGLPQAVLAEWCRATEPEELSLPPGDAVRELALTGTTTRWKWRWQAVELAGVRWDDVAFRLNLAAAAPRDRVTPDDIRLVVERGGELYPDVRRQYERGLRDLKRRVLALFPGVTCRGVPAQALIPPEPSGRRGMVLVGSESFELTDWRLDVTSDAETLFGLPVVPGPCGVIEAGRKRRTSTPVMLSRSGRRQSLPEAAFDRMRAARRRKGG